MKIALVVAGWLLCFLHGAAGAGEVSSSILVKGSESWDGGAFTYPEGSSEISVQKIEIHTGGDEVSLALHCHRMPLAAYVLKGGVKVVKPSGESSRLFREGDAFIEVMNQWHKGVFTEDTQLVVFYAGTKGAALSVKRDGDPSLSMPCK